MNHERHRLINLDSHDRILTGSDPLGDARLLEALRDTATAYVAQAVSEAATVRALEDEAARLDSELPEPMSWHR